MSQNQIIKLRGEKTYEKNKSKCDYTYLQFTKIYK